jgi:hypothetical protein
MITNLKSTNNIYDGNDHRYNVTNNFPIKKLNTTKYEELSYIHIQNDEDNEKSIVLSRIRKNNYKLNLLKKLLKDDVSEIEKLKEIESYELNKEEESKYKLNLKAGGLLEDWEFLYMVTVF